MIVGGVLDWKVSQIGQQVDQLLILREEQLSVLKASMEVQETVVQHTEAFGLLYDAYFSLPAATVSDSTGVDRRSSPLSMLLSTGQTTTRRDEIRQTKEQLRANGGAALANSDLRNSGLNQFFEPISGSSWASIAALQRADSSSIPTSDELDQRVKRHYDQRIKYETVVDEEMEWKAFDDEADVPTLFISRRRREQLAGLISQQRASAAEVNYVVRGFVKQALLQWWSECIESAAVDSGRVVNAQIGDPGSWGKLGFGARLLGGLLAVNTVLGENEGKCAWLFGLPRLHSLVAPPDKAMQQHKVVFHDRGKQAGSWMPEDLRELVGGYHSDPVAWWFSILATTLVRWDAGIESTQLDYLNTIRKGQRAIDDHVSSKLRARFVSLDKSEHGEKQTQTRDLRQQVLVGMHIRRTDKVKQNEMKFQPTMLYLDRLLRGHPAVRVHATELYLATDDPAVPAEVQTIFERLHFNITVLFNRAHIGGANPQILRVDPTDFALDSFVLSRSDIVVCTLSSNLCRYAYLHMMDRLVDPIASSNLISLDTGWYI